jgi:hypothetical protein
MLLPPQLLRDGAANRGPSFIAITTLVDSLATALPHFALGTASTTNTASTTSTDSPAFFVFFFFFFCPSPLPTECSSRRFVARP